MKIQLGRELQNLYFLLEYYVIGQVTCVAVAGRAWPGTRWGQPRRSPVSPATGTTSGTQLPPFPSSVTSCCTISTTLSILTLNSSTFTVHKAIKDLFTSTNWQLCVMSNKLQIWYSNEWAASSIAVDGGVSHGVRLPGQACDYGVRAPSKSKLGRVEEVGYRSSRARCGPECQSASAARCISAPARRLVWTNSQLT